MYYEMFVSRCRDIGEPVTVEKAKFFKEEVNQLNKGDQSMINCYSMKLGNMAIGSLCKYAKDRVLETVNIADNAIGDIGMHSVKTLI